MRHEASLIFYHCAIEMGLLKILKKPSSLENIAIQLKISNRQLLLSFLELGCTLKEISVKKGKYTLKGSMAKALVNNTALEALIKETVQYHGDIARNLDTYLIENQRGDFLKAFGGIIAESSRISESLIKAFIYHSLENKSSLEILEIGCGSSQYLKYYVDINNKNRGMAIDIDASAVEIAQSNVRKNNIDNNFIVLQDNITKPEHLKVKNFDLITSYSNVYYFSDDNRKQIFERIRHMLKKNGRFMMTTMLNSTKLTSSYYDLIFSATEDLYPLPFIDDIVKDLKNAGFSKVKIVNLLDASFKGFVAYK